MPDRLSPAQIRGARAMLNWSMVDLAEAARVSVSTVKRAESGVPQAIAPGAFGAVRDALETEGVRFLDDGGDGPGVRLRDGRRPPGRA